MREVLLAAIAAFLLTFLIVTPIVAWGERANDPTRLVQQCEEDGGIPQVEGQRFNKTIICNGSEHVLWVESTNNKEN